MQNKKDVIWLATDINWFIHFKVLYYPEGFEHYTLTSCLVSWYIHLNKDIWVIIVVDCINVMYAIDAAENVSSQTWIIPYFPEFGKYFRWISVSIPTHYSINYNINNIKKQ